MAALLSFLVVDDSEMIRGLLQNLLVEIGHFDVALAENGKSALEKVRAQALANKQFNVIICDWEMPGLTGLEFLRQTTGYVELKKTAVLMVTSINEVERVKDAVQFGVDDYLLKPFTPEAFYERLQKALQKKSLGP